MKSKQPSSGHLEEALKFGVFSEREVHKSLLGWRLQFWLALMLSARAPLRLHGASLGLIASGGKNRAGKMAVGRGFLAKVVGGAKGCSRSTG